MIRSIAIPHGPAARPLQQSSAQAHGYESPLPLSVILSTFAESTLSEPNVLSVDCAKNPGDPSLGSG
jgi:hypothetical protein